MLLEYTLHTILILPSAAALLLAICVLSLQLFVVPLHFLPDAIVTRLRRSSIANYSNAPARVSPVKSYDYVIVGGTLASHIRFVKLQKQVPRASILLLEPPLDLKSFIFTFFAGLNIGVTHTVPYFRGYPFYRAIDKHHALVGSSCTSSGGGVVVVSGQSGAVKRAITTFAFLIDELASDLAAHSGGAQGVKLPRYRIVERVESSSYSTALANRHVFPIHYTDLRASPQRVKVLLGIESVTYLGTTQDHRLAIQVNIQHQEEPFVFYVNRQLQLYDSVNAQATRTQLEQKIHQEGFEKYNPPDNDDEAAQVDPPEMLVQRFTVVQKKSMDEEDEGTRSLWTLTRADDDDDTPSTAVATGRVIEILVGFDDGTESAFETATSFAVGPFEDKAREEQGLWIEQTVYGTRHEHLVQWGYEMIQRVWDSLNQEGIPELNSDIQSTTTSSSTSPMSRPQSPLLPSSDTTTTGTSPHHHHRSMSPMMVTRHSETLQPRATIYQAGARHLVLSAHAVAPEDGLPSYLAKIWTLVFENTRTITTDPKRVANDHPVTARFVRMLEKTTTSSTHHQQDKAAPAILQIPSAADPSAITSRSNSFDENENDDDDDVDSKTMGSLVDYDASDYIEPPSPDEDDVYDRLEPPYYEEEDEVYGRPEPRYYEEEDEVVDEPMIEYEEEHVGNNIDASDTEEYFSDAVPGGTQAIDDYDKDEREDELIAALQQGHEQQQESKQSSSSTSLEQQQEEADTTAEGMDDAASAVLDQVLDENPVDEHGEACLGMEKESDMDSGAGVDEDQGMDVNGDDTHDPNPGVDLAEEEPMTMKEQDGEVVVADNNTKSNAGTPLEDEELPGTAEEQQPESTTGGKKKKKSKKTKKRGT